VAGNPEPPSVQIQTNEETNKKEMKKEKVYRIIQICGSACGVISTILFTIFFFIAYHQTSKSTIIYINRFGEANLELLLLIPFFCLSVWSFIITLNKNEGQER
jgi:lipopolysaccharide/colanic/teichoic acid biosynthesis glycosyltransferase